MHKMAKSNVFLSGLGGLGVEIGKICSDTDLYRVCCHVRTIAFCS